ncbi:MAG: hypothetical protein IKT42_04245 [Clostridia bacterium]|nr:hypothetical protein [Clostridia bacterium]
MNERDLYGVDELSKDRLFFGVDSNVRANNTLQNNLTQFEWVKRNKSHPNFWFRNINGKNSLTIEEIDFIRMCGTKIGAVCRDDGPKEKIIQGDIFVSGLLNTINKLRIPQGSAIFIAFDDDDIVSTEYMYGYAQKLLSSGFVPGFKANTDAHYPFDKEFSRGIKYENNVFKKCLVWATTPVIDEYDGITTTHLIHPENWLPFAPSGITRNDIDVWQYGRKCHPINDNFDEETFFNVNLTNNFDLVNKYLF